MADVTGIKVEGIQLVPHLSVLKPGSDICRGSNICQVVQQYERNKCLGLFKCRVPKLLNLINLKMVPNVKEISLFSISLLMFVSPFRILLQSIVYNVLIMFVVFLTRMHLQVLLHQSVSEFHILL